MGNSESSSYTVTYYKPVPKPILTIKELNSKGFAFANISKKRAKSKLKLLPDSLAENREIISG